MPKKELKIKVLKDNERLNYKEQVAQIVEGRNKRYDELYETYGPEGKLKEGYQLRNEFNSIQIPLPIVDGMSPEESKKLATAIIIGSLMDPSRLDRALTASSPDGGIVYFNQNYIVESIINGDQERVGNFPPVLVQAKKEAAAAIENMNKGDPAAAKKMLDNLIGYAASTTSITGLFRSDIDKTAKKIYFPPVSAAKLAFDHMGKEPLNAEGPEDDPIAEIQAKAGRKMLEAVDRVFDIKNNLLTEATEAGSDKRKELVEKLLFDQYIANLSYVDINNRIDEKEKYAEKIVEKIGYGPKNEYFDILSSTRTSLEQDIAKVLKANIVSDVQVILARDNGYEKLKTLYMDSIRNSELYQKMVDAEGDNLIDVMNFADDHTRLKGFDEFTNVKTGGVAKAINQKNKKRLNEELKKVENRFFDGYGDTLNKAQISVVNVDDYSISDYDTQSLLRNSEIIDGLYDLINGVDHSYIRSSKEFRDMKKTLVQLKDHAEKLSNLIRKPTPKEVRKYSDLLNKTDELAKAYLDNKTDTSSDYAKSRMSAVFELRRRLKANSVKFTNVYSNYGKEKEAKIETENLKLITGNINQMISRDCYNPVALAETDPYRQGAYKEKPLGKPDFCDYSTDRTAAYSIALMSLAAEVDDKGNPKYSIDQLMEPWQLKNEKSKAYDDTAKAILDYSVQGHQWIAKNMYNGLKNLSKQIDDYAKKIDFTSSDYMTKPEYFKLQQLCFQIFDIGQEMDHCRSELLVIVKKEHPEINDIEQVRDMFASLKGPIAAEGGYFNDIKNLGNAAYSNDQEKDNIKFINSVLAEGIIKKIMADAQKNNIPYTKIFGATDQDKSFNMMLSMIGLEHSDLYDPDLIKYAGTKLLDGNICRDIKVTFDPSEPGFATRYKVTGIPTAKQLKDDYYYECTSPDALKAIANKNTAIMRKYKRSEKPEKQVYTQKAIEGVENLSRYVTGELKIDENNRKDIIGWIKDIVAEKSYDIFAKDGLTGDTLKAAMENSLNNIPEVKALEEGYIGIGGIGAVVFEDGAKKYALSAVKAVYNTMADEAITNLKNGHYENNKELLKDAALAMTGKLYQINGKLPTNPKTNKPYTFKDYAKALTKEPSFTANINKAANGLGDAGKLFAHMAENKNLLKGMLANKDNADKKHQNQNANKDVKRNASKEQIKFKK